MTAFAGLATTSPAAMRFTTSASSRKMGGASPPAPCAAGKAIAAAGAGAGVEEAVVVEGPPSGSPPLILPLPFRHGWWSPSGQSVSKSWCLDKPSVHVCSIDSSE